MKFERFEKDLTDNIREAQLKLGYDGRPMSLNYMYTTLGHLLGCSPEEEAVFAELSQFAAEAAPRFGQISYRKIRDGVCVTVPAEGTAFVNGGTTGGEFIAELIGAVSRNGISLDEVLEVFRRHGEISVEESGCEDFDYLVRFSGGKPDEHFYCLTLEPCMGGGCHVTYHRFIPEDYAELFP